MSIQTNKSLIRAYWQAMNHAGNRDLFFETVAPDAIWHGFEPLRNLQGNQAIWQEFWQPLHYAIPDLIRRPYVFIGGEFEGNDWVCGTGDFIGTFVHDWLNIPANGQTIHFRFGEFCKIVDNKIVEFRVIVDLLDLMRQCGIHLVPPDFGRTIWIPGPLAGDGLFDDLADPSESQTTLTLIESMIFGGLNNYDGKNQASQGLERYWHSHMVWHGPAGIGSAYGLDEFKQNAQGPIVRAFPDRKGVGHQARLAEGHFAASTGWPSLSGTHHNDYMDWNATNERIGWNIMDFWRREGDKLAENWVMIDLIDAAKASGVDLLAKLSQERT